MQVTIQITIIAPILLRRIQGSEKSKQVSGYACNLDSSVVVIIPVSGFLKNSFKAVTPMKAG
jgi:hypothetical protein